ncbi:Aminodeoxychorismate synthase component 1 [BD1-7 clade bacterium]|uniref:aminodeoxychorismate synthase n=1 Tax=BD1-7 clade bacterium TaxID=2029982 RepID=A0A5S9R0Q9_9GAMM|nr:Aminodeoxychorismate synthase component 1 [BD1-7 clade bacterium]
MPHAVLLDSGDRDANKGRYDILSALPERYVEITSIHINETDKSGQSLNIESIEALKKRLAETAICQPADATAATLPFTAGWIGYATYELGYRLEAKSGSLPSAQQDEALPLFFAGYYQWAIIIDHLKRTALWVYKNDIAQDTFDQIDNILGKILNTAAPAPTSATTFTLTSEFASNTTADKYLEDFDRIQSYLVAGDCYQVNYAMRYQASFTGEPIQAYRQLRESVPSGFMSFLNAGNDSHILSISPERFIQASGKRLVTEPIKGTSARHKDPEADAVSRHNLLNSAKNRAENIMIVDLLRNDMSHHCTPNSVKVTRLCDAESFANVHHLVSTITGEIQTSSTIWDVFFDAFPGGSITGAPKIRACQIIQELEPHQREIYCGSIFYASDNGEFDSSIAIRTLLCHDGTISAWAGGGIVKDSEVEDEYQECSNKIGRLLDAITPDNLGAIQTEND